MADTRCANSAYALDVDEMILDYLLHTTIKALLDEFRARQTRSASALSSLPDGSTSLLQTFDTFLSLFKHNHPEYPFPGPERTFSLKLLEFVVLFTKRRAPGKLLEVSTLIRLKDERKRNGSLRMHWATTTDSVGSVRKVEKRVFDAWHGFFVESRNESNLMSTSATAHLQTTASKTILLADLLPRFLDISAEMAITIGQNVTEQWMILAAEFMLQSAWEQFVYLDVVRSGGEEEGTAEGQQEPLKVAFAWGWQDLQVFSAPQWESTHDGEESLLEERVNEMFGAGPDDSEVVAEEEVAAVREAPEWTRIRLEYLCAFGTGLAEEEATTTKTDQDDAKHRQSISTQKWYINRLKTITEQYPMDVFEKSVADFLEGLWKLKPKPLLVQIEAGKVDGLTGEEFEEFKRRVWPSGSG